MSSGSKSTSGITTPTFTDISDISGINTSSNQSQANLPNSTMPEAETIGTASTEASSQATSGTTSTQDTRASSPAPARRSMLETGPNSLPIVGQKGAPKKFKGKSEDVELFIKHYERLCSQRSITSDTEKVENISQYCSKDVRECIESLNSYTEKSWKGLKKDILELYDAEKEQRKFRLRHLESFVKKSRKQSAMKSKSSWVRYKRKFLTIAGWLKKEGKMNDPEQERLYFWYGIPKTFRRKLENRLLVLQPKHNLGKAFPIDQVNEAAEQLLCRDRFDMERYDSDDDALASDDSDMLSDSESSSSDDEDLDSITEKLLKRKREKLRKSAKSGTSKPKAKKTPVHSDNEEEMSEDESMPKPKSTPKGSKESELDLGELVNRLSRMSIQDNNYAALFMKACKMDPTVKDVLESIQRQRATADMTTAKNIQNNNPATNIRDLPPHMMPARQPLRCFGCGELGHTTARCPKVNELITQGIVTRELDTGRVRLANGDTVQRLSRDETLIQAIQRLRGVQSNFVTIESEEENDYYDLYDSYADVEDEADALMAYYSSEEDYENFEVYPATRNTPAARPVRKQRFDGVFVPNRQDIENKRADGRGKPINKDRVQGKPPVTLPQQPPQPVRRPPGIPANQFPTAPNMMHRAPAFDPYDSDAIMEDPAVQPQQMKPKPKGNKTGGKTDIERRMPRQSELQTLTDTHKLFRKMMDTPVSLPIGDLFGVSKSLTNLMQDAIKPRPTKVGLAEEKRPLVAAAALAPSKGSLIKLDISCNGRPITAIIDTGSQLNIVHKQIWRDIVRQPRDLTCSVTMNDANGGEGFLQGCVANIPLMCGSVLTPATCWVGEQTPFQLLLGRPWQRGNFVSIDERPEGTYLLFKDKRIPDMVQHEVLVSNEESYEKTRYINDYMHRVQQYPTVACFWETEETQELLGHVENIEDDTSNDGGINLNNAGIHQTIASIEEESSGSEINVEEYQSCESDNQLTNVREPNPTQGSHVSTLR